MNRKPQKNISLDNLDTQRPQTASSGAMDQCDSPTSAVTHWVFAAALLLAVFFSYQPAWHGGFIWDDNLHLLDNPVLKPGGLAKIWVPGAYVNYWPLTYSAYWLQFNMWGLNPLGFHIVNILLHGISALLVWQILMQLRVRGAMLAAAIFALHPVSVESVAWIAQLKGILSLLLALLSTLLYLRHEQRGGWWRFALAIGAFWLSTLAKGMALTLPIVLLALAWWQRGRIGRRDLLCVLPFFLIGVLMAGIEVWTQHLVAIRDVVRCDSFLSRAAVAGCAVWFYLWKLIWPLDLSFVYPRWQIDDRAVLSYLPGVLLVTILMLAWWQRRSWGRVVVMLIVCYVGLLAPALGFVNIYFMRYSLVADHWQYAAMIVPCATFAGVAVELGRWAHWGRPAGYLLSLTLLATLASLTWRQSRMYADIDTLYTVTIDRNPDCWMAHNNLGLVLSGRGQIDVAITHYQKALEIKPDYVEAHINIGNVLMGRGQVDAAIAHFQTALEIKPDSGVAHNNLGTVLADRGQVDEAIAHYQRALEIKPDYADARQNCDAVLARRKSLLQGLAERRESIRSRPNDTDLLNDTAWILATNPNASVRDGAEAVELAERAVKLSDGREPAILGTLAAAYAETGRFREAVEAARKAYALAIQQNKEPLAEAIKVKSLLYEAKQPFREISGR
jgi:protein O-mannosyl-transferase